MADNVAITPGSGATVATDEIDGKHYQRVKVTWGVDGVTNDASSTSPLPVSIQLPNPAALADGVSNYTTPTIGVANQIYNGSSWDRVRGDVSNGIDVDVTRVQGTIDTELPTAASLADATANPSTPTVGTSILVFNGTTWDRLRGSIANGALVDVSRVQGTVEVDASGTPIPITDNDDSITVDGSVSVDAVKVDEASNLAANVTTSTGQVVDANPDRKKITIGNDSDTVVYLAYGDTAVAHEGRRLAVGAEIEESVYTGEISAIHAGSGTKVLTVIEV